MEERKIGWKGIALGFLLGITVLLAAGQAKSPAEAGNGYRIATANSTWIINTATGDVWQLCAEQGSSKFTWLYAGRPPVKDASSQDPSD